MRRRSAWETNGRLRVDKQPGPSSKDESGARHHPLREGVDHLPYLDGGDGWLDEDAPLDPSPMWEATLVGEDLAGAFGDDGASVVVLRVGSLYARDAGRPRSTGGSLGAHRTRSGRARRVRQLDPRRRRRHHGRRRARRARAPTTWSTTVRCVGTACGCGGCPVRGSSSAPGVGRAVAVARGERGPRAHGVAAGLEPRVPHRDRVAATVDRRRCRLGRTERLARGGHTVNDAGDRPDAAAAAGGSRLPGRERRARRGVGRLRLALVLRRLPGTRSRVGVGRRPVQRAPRARRRLAQPRPHRRHRVGGRHA